MSPVEPPRPHHFQVITLRSPMVRLQPLPTQRVLLLLLYVLLQPLLQLQVKFTTISRVSVVPFPQTKVKISSNVLSVFSSRPIYLFMPSSLSCKRSFFSAYSEMMFCHHIGSVYNKFIFSELQFVRVDSARFNTATRDTGLIFFPLLARRR